MNFNEMKKNSIDVINITDSIKAPILKLSVKLNRNTIVPKTNDLIVYIDTSENVTKNRKEYIFNFSKPLRYIENITDEFLIAPLVSNQNIRINTIVKRQMNEDAILYEEEIEPIDFQPIILFEGTNYIYTNYKNADIEVVYPKDNDLVNYSINDIIYGMNNYHKVIVIEDIEFEKILNKAASINTFNINSEKQVNDDKNIIIVKHSNPITANKDCRSTEQNEKHRYSLE